MTSKRSANGSANDKISLNVITASVDIAQVSPGEMRADYAVSQTFNWQQARPFFFPQSLRCAVALGSCCPCPAQTADAVRLSVSAVRVGEGTCKCSFD